MITDFSNETITKESDTKIVYDKIDLLPLQTHVRHACVIIDFLCLPF